MRAARFTVDQIRYGRWRGPADQRASRSDEAVVVVATAEDQVEVHCHGGRAAVAAVLHDLAQSGAETVDAESFQEQACRDPDRAEMLRTASRTSTERAAAIALDQLRGAMAEMAAESRELLAAGDLMGARRRIAEVLRYEPLGAHLAEPWQVVLAGPPNVGKSSLLNALLGYRRAITFATPGTTRDVISADSAIDGWPVRLSDTAGVRLSDDPLESEGVRRAQEALQRTDLILLVVDTHQGLTETHREIAARTSAPLLLVHNKCDLDRPSIREPRATDRWPRFDVSATLGTGIAELASGISRALVPVLPGLGQPVPITEHQRTVLHRAQNAASVDQCRAAIEHLGC